MNIFEELAQIQTEFHKELESASGLEQLDKLKINNHNTINFLEQSVKKAYGYFFAEKILYKSQMNF